MFENELNAIILTFEHLLTYIETVIDRTSGKIPSVIIRIC